MIKKYRYNLKDGYINAFINELTKNGFKYDLYLKRNIGDDCKNSELSLLSIIDKKLNHIGHKQKGNNKAMIIQINKIIEMNEKYKFVYIMHI